MPESVGAKSEKKTRLRSPAYPTVGLREAVERAKKFYKTDRKAGAPPEIAVKHMGFATPHGLAMSVLSALKKFGLVAESNGRIVPTQRTIEIVELPEDDPRRRKALREAAFSPAIYSELIEQHRDSGWPSDDVLEAELITYRNFNPNSVKGFVQDLRDTLDFAGLSEENALDYQKSEGNNASGWVRPKVGDYVQWQSQGVLQFESPKRVQSLSEDGVYAFVEGSNTGLPVNDLIVEERPADAVSSTPAPQRRVSYEQQSGVGTAARTLLANTRQDVFSLPEGAVTVQWPTPLSRDSVQDLADWLEILKRKIARSVKLGEATE
jgi:hypothetical protein